MVSRRKSTAFGVTPRNIIANNLLDFLVSLICHHMFYAIFGFLVFCLFFFFVGLHLQHMEVPRLGVQSKLRAPAYTTAAVSWDLSRVCNLTTAHSNARSLTHGARPGIKPETSWFLVGFINHCAMTGTPP